ncbi:hypothetical protein [Brevibacillus dissolubilis]|nr:hypothetical protein [Brevibacillus dissolubilis]
MHRLKEKDFALTLIYMTSDIEQLKGGVGYQVLANIQAMKTKSEKEME